MHPLTALFNYFQRTGFILALVRPHLSDRDTTQWYPDWIYEVMETDEVRNQAYREAIRDTVSNKVVLELGTGRKALWATTCAKHGARKVYAIEANPKSYESSLKVLNDNAVRNVELIHGFSDRVEVPERCEVLVHDLIGSIGSSEGMVPFVEDAKRRMLTPDAVHIPRRCTTYAVVTEDPRLRLRETIFSYCARGFKRLDSLSFVRFFGFPTSAVLSEPKIFEDIEFDRVPELQNNRQLRFEITRDGQLRGVFFFIRLYLDETKCVDTWERRTNWFIPYVRLKAATSVRKGDLVEVSVHADISGNPTYSLRLMHTTGSSTREIGSHSWSGS
jgi:protein arginine N-methyltransferase 1